MHGELHLSYLWDDLHSFVSSGKKFLEENEAGQAPINGELVNHSNPYAIPLLTGYPHLGLGWERAMGRAGSASPDSDAQKVKA